MHSIEETQAWKETEARLRAGSSLFDAEGNHLAPNGYPSDLPYREWVTVRTPGFIRWFGDWLKPARLSAVINRPAPDISGYTITSDNTRDIYRAIGTVANSDTGMSVDFVNAAYGKIIRHREYDPRLIGALKELFGSSMLMSEEVPDFDTPRADGTLHKRRNSIKSFSHFLNMLQMDGKAYLIRYTVQNLRSRKGKGSHQFHSQQLTEMKISNLANVSTLSMWAETSIASDLKLASFIRGVNENVSKVVDRNGEPRIMYHVSIETFSAFLGRRLRDVPGNDEDSAQSPIFCFTTEEAALISGSVLYPAFLDIRNPGTVDWKGHGWSDSIMYLDNNAADMNDGIHMLDIIDNDKGIIADGWIAKEPRQIKSVISNSVTSRTETRNIYFQEPVSMRDAVRELIHGAVETAEDHVPVEYSEDVWNSMFGGERKIDTPIGAVIMGRNQFKKLGGKNRTDIVGMIRPTLERPSFIIRESGKSRNGSDAFNYIKAFNDKDGHRWLFSVVISQDDGWYVISNRGIHQGQLEKLILKESNSLVYVAADNQRTPSFVQRREFTGRPINNLSSGTPGVNDIIFQKSPSNSLGKVCHGYKFFGHNTGKDNP